MNNNKSKNNFNELKKFIANLNLSLTDELIKQSFTHPSSKIIDSSISDYNSLEFLGDAVLNLLVSDWLYNKFNVNEGSLTVSRSKIVNNTSLSEIGKKIGIDQLIIVPEHYLITDGDVADVFEAIFGAIYLQHGFITCQTFFNDHISKFLVQLIATSSSFMQINPINQLQEFFQKKQMKIPEPTFEKTGADNSPIYYCFYKINMNNKEISVQGTAGNKKDSKKRAAEELLKQLLETNQINQ
ncbi:MAG: ribonuclease III family protein [Candidatus Hodarchaeales archaeon]|jgi:ribonuclease-3